MGDKPPFWATEHRQDFNERDSDGRAGASSSSGRKDCSDSSHMEGEEVSRAKRMRTRRPALAVPLDGCSWRKYGQKHLTGSNLMRNYYRCARFSDLGCCSRKTVAFKERDLQVVAVVYPGMEHNHPVSTMFRHTGTPWQGGGGRDGDGEMCTCDNGSVDFVGDVELQPRCKKSMMYEASKSPFQKRQRLELQDGDYGYPDPLLSLGLGLGLQGPFYEDQRRERRGAGLNEGTGWGVGVGGDVEREKGGPETKPFAVW